MNSTKCIYTILSDIDQKEAKFRRRFNRNIFGPYKVIRNLLLVAGMILTVSMIAALIYRFDGSTYWGLVAIIGIIIFYLLVFITALLGTAWNFGYKSRMISNPLLVILENSRITLFIDNIAKQKLRDVPKDVLRTVQFEIQTEINSFRSRIALLIGAIETVGILPGILGLVVLGGRFGENQPDWAYGLVYGTGFLYLFGILGHVAISRAQRLTGLLDAIIEAGPESCEEGDHYADSQSSH